MTGAVVDIDRWREEHQASVQAVAPPPYDEKAQAVVLLGALFDRSQAKVAADVLTPDAFFGGQHREVFGALLEMLAADEPIDPELVLSWFRSRGLHGRAEVIASIVSDSARASMSNFRRYVRVVHDHWRIRSALEIAQRANVVGRAGFGDAQEFLEANAKAFMALARMGLQSPIESADSIAKRFVMRICSPAEQRSGLLVGLRTFDEMTGGLHAGHKATLAARRGIGKTSLALHAAIAVATQTGGRVLFCTTEQPKDELFERVVAHLCGVSSARFKSPQLLSTSEATRSIAGADAARKLGLTFEERIGGLHVGHIAERVRRELDDTSDGRQLLLVVVDYLQKLKSPPGHERDDAFARVSHSSWQLKELAKESLVPILVLAQMNNSRRAVDYGANDERDSDEVFFLEQDGADSGKRVLIIDKQRNGPLGKVALEFDGATSRFTDAGLVESTS